MKTYRCYTCKEYYPESEFPKSKRNRTANQPKIGTRCLKCNREQVKKYQYTGRTPKPTVTHKTCPRCERYLPASSFWRNTSQASGLQGYCKTCLTFGFPKKKNDDE